MNLRRTWLRLRANMNNVATEEIAPPIPTDVRWQAWVIGDEEFGCWYGKTEEDAIAQCLEALAERKS